MPFRIGNPKTEKMSAERTGRVLALTKSLMGAAMRFYRYAPMNDDIYNELIAAEAVMLSVLLITARERNPEEAEKIRMVFDCAVDNYVTSPAIKQWIKDILEKE